MWILSIIFGVMLLGAGLYLLDQWGKDVADARQKAWNAKRKAQQALGGSDPWPVQTQAGLPQQDAPSSGPSSEDGGDGGSPQS